MIKEVVVRESPIVGTHASDPPLLSTHSRRSLTAKRRRQQQRASRQEQYKAVPHIVQYIQEQHRRSQWSKAGAYDRDRSNVLRVTSYPSPLAPSSASSSHAHEQDGIDYTCGRVHIPSRDAQKERQRRTQRNNEYMRGLALPALVQQLASDGLLPANTTAPPALIRCMAHIVYNK